MAKNNMLDGGQLIVDYLIREESDRGLPGVHRLVEAVLVVHRHRGHAVLPEGHLEPIREAVGGGEDQDVHGLAGEGDRDGGVDPVARLLREVVEGQLQRGGVVGAELLLDPAEELLRHLRVEAPREDVAERASHDPEHLLDGLRDAAAEGAERLEEHGGGDVLLERFLERPQQHAAGAHVGHGPRA